MFLLPDRIDSPIAVRASLPFARRSKYFGKSAWETAFSLIEVVIALGIVSFAFIGMVGLIPVGLNDFRESMDTSVGSRIGQQIVNEAQQTDFPVLISAPTIQRYFDEQGTEVKDIGSSIYTAQVEVAPTTVLPGSAIPATSLATVLIKIAYNPAHQASPFNSNSRYQVYPALVAKNL